MKKGSDKYEKLIRELTEAETRMSVDDALHELHKLGKHRIEWIDELNDPELDIRPSERAMSKAMWMSELAALAKAEIALKRRKT